MEITANRYIKNDGTLDPFHWSSGVASKKEIDYFLALNGINMPLAIVGTEAAVSYTHLTLPTNSLV